MLRFHRRSRFNGWSCSNIANLIRGNNKPLSATLDDWDSWEHKSSFSKPIRHWIAEYGLSACQECVSFPGDVIYSISVYFSNRFKTQTHCLPAKLEVGQWHELSERMLHGLFETFCDFIEIEQSGSDVPDRIEGMLHLIRASHYRYGSDDWIKPDDPKFGMLTRQAIGAIEQMRLYVWWRDERPMRSHTLDCISSYEERSKLLHTHDQEDEEMMIALIKLRDTLWT